MTINIKHIIKSIVIINLLNLLIVSIINLFIIGTIQFFMTKMFYVFFVIYQYKLY